MPIVVIKTVDMEKSMQERAIDVALEALKDKVTEEEIAKHIRETFEKQYGHLWHCYCGRSFSSFVTHEKGRFIYFYIGQVGVCLFGTM